MGFGMGFFGCRFGEDNPRLTRLHLHGLPRHTNVDVDDMIGERHYRRIPKDR